MKGMINKGRTARVRGRKLSTRVKTAKGRKTSSTRWLQRQLNDPYVAEAKRLGYRSRAAFKLIELDDQFDFLRPGLRVIDLGAAPGGWTQVVIERVTAGNQIEKHLIVSLDIQPIAPLVGVTLIERDFLAEDTPDILRVALDGSADVVLSDMAASTTGHKSTDHIRIMSLLETTVDFTYKVLSPGGTFVGKVLKGGTENALLSKMKQRFESVRHAKPPASRDGSAESYVVARGFRA